MRCWFVRDSLAFEAFSYSLGREAQDSVRCWFVRDFVSLLFTPFLFPLAAKLIGQCEVLVCPGIR